MAVIAVTNYKGGVGKTTTSLNLAAAFRETGKRVLVVDFDPQANLTIHAGFKDVAALPRTLSDVLLARLRGQAITLVDIRGVIQHLPNGINLLPCNHQLVRAEQELSRLDRPETVLRELLAGVRDDYDFVLIDCLPGAGLLSTNALTAADYALVPVQAEYLAMQGLAYLLQYVAHVRATFNPRLQILGVLMTMVDLRTLHSREVLEAIRKVFQSQIRVFYSMIKVDVKLRESSKAGQTILEYAPTSKGSEAYRSLAREILTILPDYEEDPNRGTLADVDIVAAVAETATSLELDALSTGQTARRLDGPANSVVGREQRANGVADRALVGRAGRDEEKATAEQSAAAPFVACPKLGFATRPREHAMEPHADHQCFAMHEPLTLGLNRQRTFCLSADYKQCPLFLRYSLFAAEETRKRQAEAAGSSLKQRLLGGFKLFSR